MILAAIYLLVGTAIVLQMFVEGFLPATRSDGRPFTRGARPLGVLLMALLWPLLVAMIGLHMARHLRRKDPTP